MTYSMQGEQRQRKAHLGNALATKHGARVDCLGLGLVLARGIVTDVSKGGPRISSRRKHEGALWERNEEVSVERPHSIFWRVVVDGPYACTKQCISVLAISATE